MLEVFIPVTLVLATVRVVERALAMTQAVSPVANVAVAQKLIVRGVLEPDMRAEAVLEVVLPVAAVTLIAGEPVHLTVAVTLIVLPVALVVVLAGVDHLAIAPLHAALPLARVNGAVLVTQLTITVTHAVLPVALVLNALFLVDIGALAVAETVQNIAFVSAAIRPGVVAFAGDLVFLKLSAVDSAIGPLKDAAAPEQAIT